MKVIKGQDNEFRYRVVNGIAHWELWSDTGHFIDEGTCAEGDVAEEADEYYHY